MPDPHSLLSVAELVKPRSPAELAAWVDEKIASIAALKEAREPALMHQGLFKKFYEEIYPLNLFVKRCYSDQEAILVTPNVDNRPFDAVIRDNSLSPPLEIMVEITLARDPQEHLRMEYFTKHGDVALWSPVISSGNKQNRKTYIPLMAVDREEHVRRDCGWIKEAADGKASKTDHYGTSHVLVIAFDDWWEPSEMDIAMVKVFVIERVLPLPLNFSKLYVLGMSGRTFLQFFLPGPGSPSDGL